MVQDRTELGDEYVCVRGVMQHEPGLPGIHGPWAASGARHPEPGRPQPEHLPDGLLDLF
jgi:hypothetical protein